MKGGHLETPGTSCNSRLGVGAEELRLAGSFSLRYEVLRIDAVLCVCTAWFPTGDSARPSVILRALLKPVQQLL